MTDVNVQNDIFSLPQTEKHLHRRGKKTNPNAVISLDQQLTEEFFNNIQSKSCYLSFNRNNTIVNIEAKYTKYICDCGEENFSKCPPDSGLLFNHALVSFGELYNVYSKHVRGDIATFCKNEIIICRICGNWIKTRIFSFYDDCILHIKSHILPNNSTREMKYPPRISVFERCTIRLLTNEYIHEDIANLFIAETGQRGISVFGIPLVPPVNLFEKYNYKINDNICVRCITCNALYTSYSDIEILNHASSCVGSFMEKFRCEYNIDCIVEEYIYWKFY